MKSKRSARILLNLPYNELWGSTSAVRLLDELQVVQKLRAEGFTYTLSFCYSPLVIQTTVTDCSSGQDLDWEMERMQKESAKDLDIKEEERVKSNSKVVAKVPLRYG